MNRPFVSRLLAGACAFALLAMPAAGAVAAETARAAPATTTTTTTKQSTTTTTTTTKKRVARPAPAPLQPLPPSSPAAAGSALHAAGADSDRDGVADSDDWCVGGERAHVDANGCPVGAGGEWNAMYPCGSGGPREAGRDADHDGIPDNEDWCPTTGNGERVAADGCALGEVGAGVCGATPASRTTQKPRASTAAAGNDADFDGVADAADECPGTAGNIAVDAKGCAIIDKVVLKGVNFATASATLKPIAHDTLRSVAAAMKANEDLQVEVLGYTDSQGNEERNRPLSERRAQSVKDFLVKEGVAPDRLSVKGYGSQNPVDSNATAAGRANNRRVEFRVLAQ